VFDAMRVFLHSEVEVGTDIDMDMGVCLLDNNHDSRSG